MTFKFHPLQFSYIGQGILKAVAIGAVYTIEVRDNGQFQAHVLGGCLGTDTLVNCVDRCQAHFEKAVADLIEPTPDLAA